MDTYFSLKFNFSEKCAGSHLFGVSFCERRDRLVIGEFKSTLDAKGRMNIPLKLREEMGNYNMTAVCAFNDSTATEVLHSLILSV